MRFCEITEWAMIVCSALLVMGMLVWFTINILDAVQLSGF